MKTIMKFIVLVSLIFFCNSLLIAQDDNSNHLNMLDYMKVEPGMHGEYLALEKAWKKIHQHNVNAGHLLYWELTRIAMPAGSNVEYNYITRMTFKDAIQLAKYMEKFPMPTNLKEMLTPEEMKLHEKTTQLRTFVKKEVWAYGDQVMSENMEDAKIHVFNYFDHPEGKGRNDHFKVEKDIWKPVHKARIDEGKLKGWALVQLMLPYGSAQPYHDATVDIYKDWTQMMTDNALPYFDKIHQGKKRDVLLSETRKNSDLVKSEVRVKIDATE